MDVMSKKHIMTMMTMTLGDIMHNNVEPNTSIIVPLGSHFLFQ